MKLSSNCLTVLSTNFKVLLHIISYVYVKQEYSIHDGLGTHLSLQNLVIGCFWNDIPGRIYTVPALFPIPVN